MVWLKRSNVLLERVIMVSILCAEGRDYAILWMAVLRWLRALLLRSPGKTLAEVRRSDSFWLLIPHDTFLATIASARCATHQHWFSVPLYCCVDHIAHQ